MRASVSTRFLWLTALLLLSIYHSHLEGTKARHLPKSLLNTSHQEHTPISPKCLVCCILQGINLYHQWQNVLGIHIIWQLLHFAVTFSVTRILGTFSRRFPEDSPGHGSSPCHRCGGVQLPQSVFHHLLRLILLRASGSLAHKRSLFIHVTSGLDRLTAGKVVNVWLGSCTVQKHVLIPTAGNAQLDTGRVLCPPVHSPPLVGQSQHSAIFTHPTKNYSLSCSPERRGTGTTINPRHPNNPSHPTVPSGAGARAPTRGSVPPAPSRARAEKNPLSLPPPARSRRRGELWGSTSVRHLLPAPAPSCCLASPALLVGCGKQPLKGDLPDLMWKGFHWC